MQGDEVNFINLIYFLFSNDQRPFRSTKIYLVSGHNMKPTFKPRNLKQNMEMSISNNDQ